MKVFFFFFSLFFFSSAYAQEKDCVGFSLTGAQTQVIFVNGINNLRNKAKCSADTLARLLISEEFPHGSFDYSYYYNKTEGFFHDYGELGAQALLSSQAVRSPAINTTDERYNYYYTLGKIYYDSFANNLHLEGDKAAVFYPAYGLWEGLKQRIKEGKKIVLVAHSQGNFFVEAAYAVLVYEEALLFQKGVYTDSIRVVGVAPVSSTSPSSS